MGELRLRRFSQECPVGQPVRAAATDWPRVRQFLQTALLEAIHGCFRHGRVRPHSRLHGQLLRFLRPERRCRMSRPDLDMAAKIWRCALPPGVNKLVLQCFVHHLNAREGAACFGLSWPSVSRVARMCGISERTVQGHIRALERAGILRARLRTGRTTRYSIHADALAPLVFSTDTVVLDALAPTPAVFAEKPAANDTQAAENDTKPVEICTLP